MIRTHLSNCVLSLSKRLYQLIRTGSTQADRYSSRHDRFFDWDVKHQNKQTFFVSVKDDGIGKAVGIEGSSEPLLLACVNSNIQLDEDYQFDFKSKKKYKALSFFF